MIPIGNLEGKCRVTPSLKMAAFIGGKQLLSDKKLMYLEHLFCYILGIQAIIKSRVSK